MLTESEKARLTLKVTYGTSQRQRPSYRLQTVMERLSRDKWLHPNEVIDLKRKISKALRVSLGNIERRYDICEAIGMLKGQPTVSSLKFPHTARALKTAISKKKNFSELDVLLVLTKELKYDKD